MSDLIRREDAIKAVGGTRCVDDIDAEIYAIPSAEITHDDVMQYCKSRLLVLATVEFIKHQYRIGFEDGKASALGCHYLSRGKEQTMRCIDCEQHDCVVGTHFCNYKGKSGRRKPRRISEEDAHKDAPCEYVEEPKGADNDTD